MPVPSEIRAVERPKNTIVEDRGRDGPKRYAVRERGSIKCIPGRNPQPHNGKVIGFIIDGKFVPSVKSKDKDNSCSPDMLSYGSAALVKSVSIDLLADLLKVYDPVVAYTIMSIASIKVIRPGTTARRMSTHYAEMQTHDSALRQLIHRNATTAQDQNEYRKSYDAIAQKFSSAEEQKKLVDKKLSDLLKHRNIIENFIRKLKEQNGQISEFSENLWCGLLDYVTAYADGRLVFRFKNGSEFEG